MSPTEPLPEGNRHRHGTRGMGSESQGKQNPQPEKNGPAGNAIPPGLFRNPNLNRCNMNDITTNWRVQVAWGALLLTAWRIKWLTEDKSQSRKETERTSISTLTSMAACS